MPRGPVRTWPFATPTLVSSVLTDQSFIANGYLWGDDGTTHYCFVDPARYVLDAWPKTLHWSRLAWFLINITAFGLAMWLSGPGAAIALLVAIPTLPLALMVHYRVSAEDQPGAVAVSNGPQMEYPVKGGSNSFTTLVLGTGSAGGLIAGIAAYLGLKSGIVLFGVTLTGPLVASLLTAIGAGANAVALAAYIAGQFTNPYQAVRGTGVNDAGLGYGGTWYIARTGRPINTYSIGSPTPPAGAPVVCGGLVGVIAHRAVLYSPPGWSFVSWGLIPLSPQGRPYEPPPGSESFVYDPHRDDPEHWVKGLILVVGSKTFNAAQTGAMLIHGVTDAVGTDGFISPVLGAQGELVIECHMLMDCVQKYGLKMVP
jgi:hypothetical protein